MRAKEGCVVRPVWSNLTFPAGIIVHSHIARTYRKMVNVNTPLPFNLHNRDIHGRRFDPSSSRSARSRSAHATLGGPTGYGPEMLPEVPSRMPSYSPTRDRDPSPSLETSGSTTSLRPGDASYLPPDVEAENGGRRPILNVRLVRGGGGYGIGGSFTSRSRQGRTVPRGRPGRADTAAVPEETPEFNDSLNGEASHEENTQVAAEPSPSSEETSTPRAAGFNIQDVGKITCSWGD